MKAPFAAATASSQESSTSPSPVPEQDVLVAPYASLLLALDNKQKYLEARADKLQKFDEEAKLGKQLSEDKEKARLCLPDVKNQLGFIATFQKKMVERQREYTKKSKQRNYGQNQEREQLRSGTIVDILTAQYILGQYASIDGQRRIANSFTSEERTRLDVLVQYFLPEIATPKKIREAFVKSAAEISSILRQNQNCVLAEGFNAADAYQLLETLLVVVENTEDEPLTLVDPIVDSVSPPVEPEEDEPSVTSTAIPSPTFNDIKNAPAPTNTPVDTVPANTPIETFPIVENRPVEKATITFGYFSEESSQKSNESSPVPTTDLPDVAPVTEKPIAVADVNKDGKPTVDNRDNKRGQRRPRNPRKKVESGGSASASDNAENKENKTQRLKPKAPRTDRPRQLKDENKDKEKKPNVAPRTNGVPRGGRSNNINGQRRFNGPKENGNENGTRGPRPANKTNQGTSAGQRTGYKRDGYAANNGYSNGGNGYSVPTGYIREGGYVRPPVGTCGFTLKVQ